MEFERKKKRGQSQKVKKTWLSKEGYRIVWRREACGVEVTPHYQACVRVCIPNYGGSKETKEMWDFVSTKRKYRTLKAATQDCERHYKKWCQACRSTGKRILLQIFGKVPYGFPKWALKKMSRGMLATLTQL